MSVEQFPQFRAGDQRPDGNVYAMQSLPNSVDWPHEQERPDGTRRGTLPPAPHPGAPRLRWFWQALVALVLLFVLGAGGTLFYIDRMFAGKIYPNLSIRGVPVGEMTPEQASTLLYERYAAFLQQPLTLTYGDRSWTPTPSELGVVLEIDRSVEQAFNAGRGHGLINNLREVAAVWQSGLELPLRLTIDQQAMQQYLVERAAEVEYPATDANLVLRGTSVNALSAISGRQVLVNETLHDITAALQTLESQTVALRTRELLPMLADADLVPVQQALDTLLQAPLLLEAGDTSWEWLVEDIAGMITIQRVARSDGAGDQLNVTLDREQIRTRLHEIAEATEQKGKYPRVDWNNGDLTIIREGTSGQRMDEAQAEELVLTAVASANRTITLPFKETPPPVTADNLDQLGIRELLAVGKSDFKGSADYRVTNIKAGMKLLHGILLAPGDEFSFNENIGRIDASNGFVEGYAIIQNRTQLEWGGGICQDSTTIFRAAFWAGLPITERWGHSFYINWYDKYAFGEYGDGPGMDATIFTGGPDLKFLNDTGNWLLIQTFVDSARTLAEVRIYGTSTGRVVELDGPTISNRKPAPPDPVYVGDPEQPRGSLRQSDKARGGMDITFTRIVKVNGVETRRDEFLTRFRPWPNIYVANPADLGPDGKPISQQQSQPTEAAPPADSTQPPPADSTQPPPADSTQPPPSDGTQPPPSTDG